MTLITFLLCLFTVRTSKKKKKQKPLSKKYSFSFTLLCSNIFLNVN